MRLTNIIYRPKLYQFYFGHFRSFLEKWQIDDMRRKKDLTHTPLKLFAPHATEEGWTEGFNIACVKVGRFLAWERCGTEMH